VNVPRRRDRAWNYTLDGVDINETSLGGGTRLRSNESDMLAEFRVITGNTTAEYGRNSGGQVALVTKSGTNELHGTGFWFYRTPRLNANEFENNLAAIGKRQLVQNIYGGSIGGPIRKNKTFFFANVQALRAWQSTIVDRTVFTPSARQGIFRYVNGGRNRPSGVAGASVDASGNVLPGVNVGSYNIVQNDPQHLGLDPTTLAAVNQAPPPNNFALGDGLNTAGYTFATGLSERQHDQVIKVDHYFNSSNTVFFRGAWGSQDTNCDSVKRGLGSPFPARPVWSTPSASRAIWPSTGAGLPRRASPTSSSSATISTRSCSFSPLRSTRFRLNFPTTYLDSAAQYQFGNNRTIKNLQLVEQRRLLPWLAHP